MDNVLVDFKTGIDRISSYNKKEYEGRYDEVPDIFSLMDPMKGAIDSYNQLSSQYDTYIFLRLLGTILVLGKIRSSGLKSI
jgi:5'-nucleotidase